jgi:eukaryotic-like serine/threonine-protein kinase
MPTTVQPHELRKDPNNGEVIWCNWANVSEQLALVLNQMGTYHFRDRYASAESALQALAVLQPQQQKTTPPPRKTIPTIQAQPTKTIIYPNWSRRKVIKTVGFTGAGLALAIVLPRLWQSDSEEISTTDDIKTTTPTPKISPSNPSAASSNPGQVMKTAGWLARGLGLTVVGNRLLFRSGSGDISNTTPTNPSLQTFTFETVTVNAQGKITNRRNLQARYFAENLGNGVTLEMVQIPGGTFTMGSPAGEAGRFNNEGPQRQVRVPGFFMGKYPVTQAQYQAIMGTNPAYFKDDKRPVEQVTWDDAVEFCKKLSQKTGKTYRLPSEAEWEYACRAGTTTPFYFGETITTDLVNYHGNFPYGSAPKGVYREQTTDVGNFPPNSFGLYDMHGNIWEWCQDIYNSSYQGAPTDGSPWLSGSDNNMKRLRGGSWLYMARICRSATRNVNARTNRVEDVGFRVVAVA